MSFINPQNPLTMNTTPSTTVADWVREDFRTAPIFKRHQIDFCCNGKRSLSTVCEEKGLDLHGLMAELEGATQDGKSQAAPDYQQWPLDLLIDYIEKKHHRYVEQRSQDIPPFLNKVVKVHGQADPELQEIKALFEQTLGALAQHMKKEELVLFPFIRKMVQEGSVPESHFGSVENPIANMEHEHAEEGERLARIAELSHQYTPPEHACNTYRATYGLLQEFEDDLHTHIHLENNILFPRALALQEELMAQQA